MSWPSGSCTANYFGGRNPGNYNETPPVSRVCLLGKCLSIAEKQGFKTVHGIVLHENKNMLALGKNREARLQSSNDQGR
jgi:hypothetical protein